MKEEIRKSVKHKDLDQTDTVNLYKKMQMSHPNDFDESQKQALAQMVQK